MSANPEPPWDDLDPGIVDVVRLLHANGFRTTDSGDGSKAAHMECALEWAMVVVRSDRASMLADADAILALPWADLGREVPDVEATYCPNVPIYNILVHWPTDDADMLVVHG